MLDGYYEVKSRLLKKEKDRFDQAVEKAKEEGVCLTYIGLHYSGIFDFRRKEN